MKNTILYLFGYPGAGKYTIAKEIAKREPFTVVDNHLIYAPIFSLMGADGKTELPKVVWNYADKIWKVAADTMLNLAPKDASFILTNILLEGDAKDRAHFNLFQNVAKKRGACFVPVRVEISDLEEHKRRITAPDRAARFKAMDEDGPQRYAAVKKLLCVRHVNALTLDVAGLSAAEAAERILGHARKCASVIGLG